jgi:hypothetical protein
MVPPSQKAAVLPGAHARLLTTVDKDKNCMFMRNNCAKRALFTNDNPLRRIPWSGGQGSERLGLRTKFVQWFANLVNSQIDSWDRHHLSSPPF